MKSNINNVNLLDLMQYVKMVERVQTSHIPDPYDPTPVQQGIGVYYTSLLLGDLRRDPGEQYNLLKYYPEIVEQLEKIASEAREELGDDLTGNPRKNRREPGRTD